MPRNVVVKKIDRYFLQQASHRCSQRTLNYIIVSVVGLLDFRVFR